MQCQMLAASDEAQVESGAWRTAAVEVRRAAPATKGAAAAIAQGIQNRKYEHNKIKLALGSKF